ncbi:MAG TPA: ABC transporter substrate-binding protein [Alphaproteobacteria bacterium]|nr:ABC transporter substrate-binding protein [Alphaproteobacteria bacterium]
MRLSSFKAQALTCASLLALVAFTAPTAQAAGPMAEAAPAYAPLTVQVSQDVAGAQSFIDGMAQKAINFLADQSMPQAQKTQKFKELLSSSFDLKTIGRFALGRYWKTATPAQQAEYQGLFDKMVVKVYSQRFKDYQGQQLVVDSAKAEGDKDVLVTSFIIPSSGPKVQVDWRVRNKDGRHKIVDIIVEGVSMAVTQRSEFASVIQAGGGNVSALIDHLKK